MLERMGSWRGLVDSASWFQGADDSAWQIRVGTLQLSLQWLGVVCSRPKLSCHDHFSNCGIPSGETSLHLYKETYRSAYPHRSCLSQSPP